MWSLTLPPPFGDFPKQLPVILQDIYRFVSLVLFSFILSSPLVHPLLSCLIGSVSGVRLTGPPAYPYFFFNIDFVVADFLQGVVEATVYVLSTTGLGPPPHPFSAFHEAFLFSPPKLCWRRPLARRHFTSVPFFGSPQISLVSHPSLKLFPPSMVQVYF